MENLHLQKEINFHVAFVATNMRNANRKLITERTRIAPY